MDNRLVVSTASNWIVSKGNFTSIDRFENVMSEEAEKSIVDALKSICEELDNTEAFNDVFAMSRNWDPRADHINIVVFSEKQAKAILGHTNPSQHLLLTPDFYENQFQRTVDEFTVFVVADEASLSRYIKSQRSLSGTADTKYDAGFAESYLVDRVSGVFGARHFMKNGAGMTPAMAERVYPSAFEGVAQRFGVSPTYESTNTFFEDLFLTPTSCKDTFKKEITMQRHLNNLDQLQEEIYQQANAECSEIFSLDNMIDVVEDLAKKASIFARRNQPTNAQFGF